eukprot:scpid67569/ scgid6994/ 
MARHVQVYQAASYLHLLQRLQSQNQLLVQPARSHIAFVRKGTGEEDIKLLAAPLPRSTPVTSLDLVTLQCLRSSISWISTTVKARRPLTISFSPLCRYHSQDLS